MANSILDKVRRPIKSVVGKPRVTIIVEGSVRVRK